MPCNQSNTLKHALCSKLGGGLERAIVPVDSSVVPIDGPYSHRAGELQDMVLRSMGCVNINSEYTTIDSHFSILDYLKTVNNQETDLYFYHSDHLGSSSFITDADGIVSQHSLCRSIFCTFSKEFIRIENESKIRIGIQYLPYGELFAEQRDNTARYYTPYKFSGKEKDEETGYSYFGARYYMPELSIWSAVDPLADERSWLSPYNYCQLNPLNRVDLNGLLDTKYVDENGNEIANTDDGINRTVTVKNDQRSEFNKAIEDANKGGTVNTPEFNKSLTAKIDEHNFSGTTKQRAAIGAAAASHNGSTAWNYEVKKDNYPAGTEKCNKFVYDVITEGGVTSPKNVGGNWPLSAGKWGDPNVFIKGWVVLPALEAPQAGDVAAYRYDGWNDATGHSAVVTSPNGITGTSDRTHNINTCTPEYFQGQAAGGTTVIYRRYIGITQP